MPTFQRQDRRHSLRTIDRRLHARVGIGPDGAAKADETGLLPLPADQEAVPVRQVEALFAQAVAASLTQLRTE